MNKSWLLHLLADSALPTGGFVASAGLESAHQSGFVRSTDDLRQFVNASAEQCASGSLAFVRESWHLSNRINTNGDESHGEEILNAWTQLDKEFEATINNAVAKRASLAQGAAMLTLYLKCFASSSSPHEALITRYRLLVRREQAPGHLPVCFGLVCAGLAVPLDETLRLFIFLFARSLYSAAVRLNIVGPYESQRLLLETEAWAEQVVERWMHTPVEEACQVNPVLDMLQARHDILYSRVFNS
ncbi:uncharacterized protein VTP21DRAFT_4890 [Calcarisporiella thermophila]|uniref:uncharacterized protein n=1 Tax=Calcarisporiella thermophila TaxID=911321 RepID=UPI003743C246